jgi:hypothetical protein
MGDETEPAVGLILSAAAWPQPSNFLLRAIPSELGSAADLAGFLDVVATKMEPPFERLLDHFDAEEEGPPVAALVADTYVLWVVVVNLVSLRLPTMPSCASCTGGGRGGLHPRVTHCDELRVHERPCAGLAVERFGALQIALAWCSMGATPPLAPSRDHQ